MTERPSDVIVADIERIDVRLFDVRFNSNLPQNEMLKQLTELVEQRNKLTDELQAARKTEFKRFLDGLNLKELDITPFYVSSRRAKLSIGNTHAQQLTRTVSNPGDPWRKMLRTYVSKSKGNGPDAAVAQLVQARQRMIETKKAEIERQLSILMRKPMLSPTDVASKCRLESEANVLAKYDAKGK